MPGQNSFSNQTAIVSDPSSLYVAITPSDTTDLANVANSIYIGGSGDLTVLRMDGVSVVFKAVPQGGMLPIRVSRVMATGTSATFLVAL